MEELDIDQIVADSKKFVAVLLTFKEVVTEVRPLIIDMARKGGAVSARSTTADYQSAINTYIKSVKAIIEFSLKKLEYQYWFDRFGRVILGKPLAILKNAYTKFNLELNDFKVKQHDEPIEDKTDLYQIEFTFTAEKNSATPNHRASLRGVAPEEIAIKVKHVTNTFFNDGYAIKEMGKVNHDRMKEQLRDFYDSVVLNHVNDNKYTILKHIIFLNLLVLQEQSVIAEIRLTD